ncbi:MAG: LytTR family DNA-binding domain-containing protein [Tannerellaceae bacterium]|nr:LytTR family DNA-binding domain-containing protein [Tannerellaceae bacterium]
MKILIIEDEVIAAQNLMRMLREIRSDFEILTVLQTIKDSVEWFNNHPEPELLFMDIHLADGSSFSIFDKVEIEYPIIFTTAYDEYSLSAFEVNGIDYLLKPINRTRLTKAISKFERFGKKYNTDNLRDIIESIAVKENRYRSHFLIPHRDKLIPLPVQNIAYACAEMKTARIFTFDGQDYPLDFSLEELMKNLDKEAFFRANRQYIISRHAIKDFTIWFSGKLTVNLTIPVSEKILVSKARVPEFKAWFTRINYL